MGKAAIGFALAALLGTAATVRAEDSDVIEYRQHIMKSMGEQMAAIGMILEEKAPADNFAVHLKVLAVIAPQAKKAFEPAVAGGNAKPEVWSDAAEFAKQLDTLVSATDELAKLADGGSVANVGAKMATSLNCKSCHDTFRVPPK